MNTTYKAASFCGLTERQFLYRIRKLKQTPIDQCGNCKIWSDETVELVKIYTIAPGLALAELWN